METRLLNATDNLSTIKVKGEGSVVVIPDTASVSMGVDISRETLQAAKEDAAVQMNAILTTLRLADIDRKDIKTSHYNVWPVREQKKNYVQGEVIGYRVTTHLQVIIRSLDKAGDVLEAALLVGANDVGGLNFYVEDDTHLKRRALQLAVEDAVAKAEAIAAATGKTLGRIVSIREGSEPDRDYDGVMHRAYASDASMAPMEAGTTNITAEVTLVAEIAP